MNLKRPTKFSSKFPHSVGGMTFSGVSFKKLEKDGEEYDLLTISDQVSSISDSDVKHDEIDLLKLDDTSKSDCFCVSSKLRKNSSPDYLDKAETFFLKKGNKSLSEYRDIISGWKGKIQGKFNKKLDDPLIQHGLNMDIDKDSLSSSIKQDISLSDFKSFEVTKTSLDDDKAFPGALYDNYVSSILRTSSDEKCIDEHPKLEKNSFSVPMKLSNLSADMSADEDIFGPVGHSNSTLIVDHDGLVSSSQSILCQSKLSASIGLFKSTDTSNPSDVLSTSTCTDKYSEREITSNVNNVERKQVGYQLHFLRCLIVWIWHGKWTPLLLKLLPIVICFVAYCVMPLHSFTSGLIFGSIFASLIWKVYIWIIYPPKIKDPFSLEPIKTLACMEIPDMKEPLSKDGVYKGWMNEILNYIPDDYHINHTFTVFATLDGVVLRLQRPKTTVPRRAMHSENITAVNFIHQRHFDLTGSHVSLQPFGLQKKRLWSKKYPICIVLKKPGTKSRNNVVDAQVRDLGFELVSEEKCEIGVLFLFSRTGHEKEQWYRRFVAASLGKPLGNFILDMQRAVERQKNAHNRPLSCESGSKYCNSSSGSHSSACLDTSDKLLKECEDALDPMVDFARYMGHLMPAGAFYRVLNPDKSYTQSNKMHLPFTGPIVCDNQLYWLNTLIGRCFYDFLRDAWWIEKVKDKLQKKLSKIHVPFFIEELQLTDIDMGKEMPVIRRAAHPYMDEQGFWVDLDVSYGGGFQMAIETKVNLMKLKQSSPTLAANADRSTIAESDDEESAESTTDEDEESFSGAIEKEKQIGGRSKKMMKYLQKFASSKYFQQATEYKYIKRAMENVSNTPLQLRVTVKHLSGKLAINIPPPPSDRLWYGFRGVPRLSLVAKPQVGERVVSITHITEWIGHKLELEFQRVFVMPNMDDLVVPILSPMPVDVVEGERSSNM